MASSVTVRKSGRSAVQRCGPGEAERLATFVTRLGWIAIHWRGDIVERLVFAHESRVEATRAIREWIDDDSEQELLDVPLDELPNKCLSLVRLLQDYANGVPADFSAVRIDTDWQTPFQRRVTAECRAIAWGQTRTYGQLAEQAGRPGAARAVGSVMACNRFPLIVPCHRVVPAGGKLGGFSAPGGISTKEWLLQHEGAWPLQHSVRAR